jgi:hypothetical protein
MEEIMPRKSPYPILLTPVEEAQLTAAARKYTSPYYIVVRAKIVLLAARGLPNSEIAARLDLPRQIVSKWRKRFFQHRLDGLADRPRPGRPPTFSPSGGRAGESAGV